MTPEQAIGKLSDLRSQLHTRLQHFAGECEGIQAQWAALGRAGGQRADHAAALLGKLKNHLQGISGYCDGVVEQIEAMIADPFGDGE
jgi:hypothetical protein